MCEFFSFCSDGKGTFFYFEPKDIKKLDKESNPKNYNYNSHASICEFYKINEENGDITP